MLVSHPHVSFHVNGGPVAMPEPGFARLVNASDIALKICTAGNLRTALLTARLLEEAGQLERLLIATDTPTGSGIMPLGMLYTISHLESLGGVAPERAIAAATGNNAQVYGLNSGVLAVGRDADVILLDACAGGACTDALSALAMAIFRRWGRCFPPVFGASWAAAGIRRRPFARCASASAACRWISPAPGIREPMSRLVQHGRIVGGISFICEQAGLAGVWRGRNSHTNATKKNPQHHTQRTRLPANPSLRIMRLNQGRQPTPRNHTRHLRRKNLPARHLALIAENHRLRQNFSASHQHPVSSES